MRCQCLKTNSLFSTSLKFNVSPSRAFPIHRKPSSNFKPFRSSSSSSPTKMSAQTIEHIVLFKVKDDSEPSKVTSMINGLNGLKSLTQVLHITAGSIHKNRSSAFAFTHMLHSRYSSKEDLNGYAVHPEHVKVVQECVLPNCDDVMAVDWVANLDGPIAPKPGSAMKLTFLKLKEGLGDTEKGQLLGVIGGIKDKLPSIEQISFGENFSPRAKGFSIASLAVFPGLGELEALDSNEEMVKEQKDKVRDLLDGVIVIDYVIPATQNANL